MEIWVGLPILEVSQTHEDANPQVYLPFDTDMASHFLICTCSYCCSIPIALHDHLLHQGISKQIDKDILSLPNDTIYLAAAKSWIVTVRLTSGSWYPNITRCVCPTLHIRRLEVIKIIITLLFISKRSNTLSLSF